MTLQTLFMTILNIITHLILMQFYVQYLEIVVKTHIPMIFNILNNYRMTLHIDLLDECVTNCFDFITFRTVSLSELRLQAPD